MNHADATRIVDATIPYIVPDYRALVQAIGSFESNYGTAWHDGLKQQGEILVPDPEQKGSDSHNWGAMQGTGPAGYFITRDSYLNDAGQKVEYTAKYRKYHNDSEAIVDLANRALTNKVTAEIDNGSILHALFELAKTGYYETVDVPRSDKTIAGYLQRAISYFNHLKGSLAKIFDTRGWSDKNFLSVDCYGYYTGRTYKGGPIVTGYINTTPLTEGDVIQKAIGSSKSYAVLFYTIYSKKLGKWSKWRQLMPPVAYPDF